jgi:hypothetical protein
MLKFGNRIYGSAESTVYAPIPNRNITTSFIDNKQYTQVNLSKIQEIEHDLDTLLLNGPSKPTAQKRLTTPELLKGVREKLDSYSNHMVLNPYGKWKRF